MPDRPPESRRPEVLGALLPGVVAALDRRTTPDRRAHPDRRVADRRAEGRTWAYAGRSTSTGPR